MSRIENLSLLIVDDQSNVLEIYDDILKNIGHRVECVSMPAEVSRYVRNHLFDAVIIDAKMMYKGAPLGGLILAEEVSKILGIDSILLISQYNVRDNIRYFNPAFAFLSKPESGADIFRWIKGELINKLQVMIKRQYGFVAMPFGIELSDEWYKTKLVPWMHEAGFTIKRMDEIPTTRAINQEILDRIGESHFVIQYAPGNNPNVYFEAGYAHALGKYVVLISEEIEKLPFDVRGNYALPICHIESEEAKKRLLEFMCSLRGAIRR